MSLIVAHISRSVWVAWVKWVGCHAFGAPAEHLHPCGDTPKACPPVREPHAFAVILHGRCCFGRSAKAWHPRSPKDVCNDEAMSPERVRPAPYPGLLLHRNSFDGRPCCGAPTYRSSASLPLGSLSWPCMTGARPIRLWPRPFVAAVPSPTTLTSRLRCTATPARPTTTAAAGFTRSRPTPRLQASESSS